MTDLVFVVPGVAPSAVLTSLTTVLASSGLRPGPGGDGARTSFIDERGSRPTVSAELRRDRFGTVVIATGLSSPDLARTVLAQLRGLQAPPPIGRPVAGAAPWVAEPARPLPAAPVRTPAPADSELDEHTRPRHRARPTGGFALRLEDGRSLKLEARMLLGRDPAAPPGMEGVALVPIDDPERALSKTHLAIEVRSGRVMVQDLGSTNGTCIIDARGGARDLTPREPVELPLGDLLVFGVLRATLVERS